MDAKFARGTGVIFLILSITIGLSGEPGVAIACFVISLALFWKSSNS